MNVLIIQGNSLIDFEVDDSVFFRESPATRYCTQNPVKTTLLFQTTCGWMYPDSDGAMSARGLIDSLLVEDGLLFRAEAR